MCINHRSADIAVAEEFLNRADVIPIFKQMGCKRMSKRVRGSRFGYSGLANGLFHCFLQNGFVQMMSAFFSRYFVCKMADCWKYPLPAPLFPAFRYLRSSVLGKATRPMPRSRSRWCCRLTTSRCLASGSLTAAGSIVCLSLSPLTNSDYDLIAGEIDFLDSQPQAFHQSEAWSLKQHSHDPIGAVEEAENRPDFRPCQHNV